MNKKGQAIMSEFGMILFIVIAAIVAMSTFVQRSFEARLHDERNFMVDSLVNSGACDANCLQATGNKISHEYEPYYAMMLSDVTHNEDTNMGSTNGSAEAIGAIYTKATNENTKTSSNSVQLPPQCANGGC